MTSTAPARPTSRTIDLLSTRLRSQQERVAGIVAGLDDEQLRRPVLASGWSCLGMVHHLTEGTRFWLRRVMVDDASTPLLDDDFEVAAEATGAEVLDAYARVCADGLDGIAHLPADASPAWWPEGWWGGWRLHDLEEVLVHLLVETSTHAGHLDAVREVLDGATWDYASGRVAVRAE